MPPFLHGLNGTPTKEGFKTVCIFWLGVVLMLLVVAIVNHTITIKNEYDAMRHHFKVVDCAGARTFKSLMEPPEHHTTFDENMILCKDIVSERESFKNKVKEFLQNVKKRAIYLFS